MTQYYDLEIRTYTAPIFSRSVGLGDIAGIWWPAIGGPYIAHATSTKPADKEHDKYQHLVTYSDETVIKHVYFNVDDEVIAFNQTLHNV